MFHTSGYNLPLDNWDVSNVTNMISLFRGSVFNQDISNWNTNSLTQLGYAFSLTSAFNQDISNWNTSNVVMMTDAFMGAEVFNQNLSNWDVSNVNDFSNMFLEAQAISDQNKCAIHTSWSTNTAWPYDWSGLCMPQINNYSLVFDGASWVNLGNLNYISEGGWRIHRSNQHKI